MISNHFQFEKINSTHYLFTFNLLRAVSLRLVFKLMLGFLLATLPRIWLVEKGVKQATLLEYLQISWFWGVFGRILFFIFVTFVRFAEFPGPICRNVWHFFHVEKISRTTKAKYIHHFCCHGLNTFLSRYFRWYFWVWLTDNHNSFINHIVIINPTCSLFPTYILPYRARSVEHSSQGDWTRYRTKNS